MNFLVLSLIRFERIRFPFWTFGPQLYDDDRSNQAGSLVTKEMGDAPSNSLFRSGGVREVCRRKPLPVLFHAPKDISDRKKAFPESGPTNRDVGATDEPPVAYSKPGLPQCLPIVVPKLSPAIWRQLRLRIPSNGFKKLLRSFHPS